MRNLGVLRRTGWARESGASLAPGETLSPERVAGEKGLGLAITTLGWLLGANAV